MEEKFIVRQLKREDSAIWMEMWHEYLKFYQTKLADEVTTNTLNVLLSGKRDIGCLVACNEQNDPIGFLTYILHFSTWRIAPVCYLHDLFVQEKYRKSGAAKLLLNSLREMSTNLHFSRIYWLAKPNNNAAKAFYDKVAQGQEWIRYAID